MALNGISTAENGGPADTKIYRRALKLDLAKAKRQAVGTPGYRIFNQISGTHSAYVNGTDRATLRTLSGTASPTLGHPWNNGSLYIMRIRSWDNGTNSPGNVVTTCNEGDYLFLEVEWANLTVDSGPNSYLKIGGANITNNDASWPFPAAALDPIAFGLDNSGPDGSTGAPIQINTDNLTEGNETLTWSWYVNGIVVASTSVTIMDTSKTPPP